MHAHNSHENRGSYSSELWCTRSAAPDRPCRRDLAMASQSGVKRATNESGLPKHEQQSRWIIDRSSAKAQAKRKRPARQTAFFLIRSSQTGMTTKWVKLACACEPRVAQAITIAQVLLCVGAKFHSGRFFLAIAQVGYVHFIVRAMRTDRKHQIGCARDRLIVHLDDDVAHLEASLFGSAT